MRVLRVIPSLNPRVGGPAVAGINSVISGARAGVQSEVAVVVRPGETAASWWRQLERRCALEGLSLVSFPVSVSRVASRLYDPSTALVRWLIRQPRSRFDIIHVESPWTSTCAIASLYAAGRSIPLVISPNAVLMPPDLARGGLLRRTAKRLGSRAYGRAASAVVCSSPLEARDATRSGVPTHKIEWIYHPVVDDRIRYEPCAPPAATGLRVGYLGRLHPTKNVQFLIEAVGKMDRTVTLRVAGRGDAAFEAELVKSAERQLPGRTEFIGWVNQEEKAVFLSGIDVLAMPSEYECFGVSAVEALAAGVPVIVSDRVGVADIVRSHRAGMVVPPTIAGIADGLRRYRDDPSAIAADRSQARAAAMAETGFAAHGARLLDLYSTVLDRRS